MTPQQRMHIAYNKDKFTAVTGFRSIEAYELEHADLPDLYENLCKGMGLQPLDEADRVVTAKKIARRLAYVEDGIKEIDAYMAEIRNLYIEDGQPDYELRELDRLGVLLRDTGLRRIIELRNSWDGFYEARKKDR